MCYIFVLRCIFLQCQHTTKIFIHALNLWIQNDKCKNKRLYRAWITPDKIRYLKAILFHRAEQKSSNQKEAPSYGIPEVLYPVNSLISNHFQEVCGCKDNYVLSIRANNSKKKKRVIIQFLQGLLHWLKVSIHPLWISRHNFFC